MTGLGALPTGNDRILRLAEWLSDPAGWSGHDDGLDPAQRATLASSPLLRPELNRYLSRSLGTRDLPLDADFLASLVQDDRLARGSALATAPEDVLHRAAQFLGAALCHDRLRAAVLRVERERLSSLLGEEALAFGLRRAPLLARPLQSLALTGRDDVVDAGRSLCASLIRNAGAALHDLFRLRQIAPADTVELNDAQAQAGWAVLEAAA